jgi:hypothetical protein
MPTRDVSFNRLAIKDYREARDWYAERSEEVAARFIAAVDSAVDGYSTRRILGQLFSGSTGECLSISSRTPSYITNVQSLISGSLQ